MKYFEEHLTEGDYGDLSPLTLQVIGDMVDEIVHGVLKTGKLTKKGHKRKNWKTRWFVLQRTVLRYYQSRDNMVLKVSGRSVTPNLVPCTLYHVIVANNFHDLKLYSQCIAHTVYMCKHNTPCS